jgi:hypothetical protein
MEGGVNMAHSIVSEIRLEASRDTVWEGYRDRLNELAPLVPAVKEIETKSRSEQGPKTNIVNVWLLDGDLPAAFSKFLPPSILSYKDTAVWDNSAFVVNFTTEPADGSGLYVCKGVNTFSENADGSMTLRLDLTLEIRSSKVPGLPKFLAKKIIPKIEKFVSGELSKNLQATSHLLVAYLAGNPSITV